MNQIPDTNDYFKNRPKKGWSPVLVETWSTIMQEPDPRLRPVIAKLFNAGCQIMYSEKGGQMMTDQIGDGKDAEAIGEGVIKLIGMVFNESKKTAPDVALMPASILLLCEGLGFLEEAGAVEVTSDFLAKCTLALGSAFIQLKGGTPEMMQRIFKETEQNAGNSSSTPVATKKNSPPPAPTGILANAQGSM